MVEETGLMQMGRLGAPYGVRGWLKVQSFAEPADNLAHYQPWYLQDPAGMHDPQPVELVDFRPHGKGFVTRLAQCEDRTAAEGWRGWRILVPRSCLPALPPGRFYWADLEGLQVLLPDGAVLGRLDHLLETGAADVMVIVGDAPPQRRLVPFIMGETVKDVDLQRGVICIDPDYESA